MIYLLKAAHSLLSICTYILMTSGGIHHQHFTIICILSLRLEDQGPILLVYQDLVKYQFLTNSKKEKVLSLLMHI